MVALSRAGLGALTAAAALLALLAVLSPPAAAVDTDPPLVLDFAPSDGGFVNGSSVDPSGLARVEVTATFRDLGSPLDPNNTSTMVFAEGALTNLTPSLHLAEEDGQGNVASFDLFLLPDGRYRLVFDATDDSGNAAHQETNFTVDLEPPVVAVSAPRSTNQTTVSIHIDAQDNGSGVALPVNLTYRSACSYSWFPGSVQTVVLPGRLVGEATVPVCVGTQNEFIVTVVDAAGNSATVHQDRISCDLTPPKFTAFGPKAFSRVMGPLAQLSTSVTDDTSGVAAVEYRYSTNGGHTWSEWNATMTVAVITRGFAENAFVPAPDGATIAVQWRAWDTAGNGPTTSPTIFFYVNGPPFIEDVSPADGSTFHQYSQVRLWALADDPDSDNVSITVSSDKDGPLGRADGHLAPLSLGFHNLTYVLYDGHGHYVNYTVQVQVVPRPPPDPRSLLLTAVIAGAMLWFAYAAWAKQEERRPRDEQSLAKTPDEAPQAAKA